MRQNVSFFLSYQCSIDFIFISEAGRRLRQGRRAPYRETRQARRRQGKPAVDTGGESERSRGFGGEGEAVRGFGGGGEAGRGSGDEREAARGFGGDREAVRGSGGEDEAGLPCGSMEDDEKRRPGALVLSLSSQEAAQQPGDGEEANSPPVLVPSGKKILLICNFYFYPNSTTVHFSKQSFLCADPFDWTSENISAWLAWAGRKLDVPRVDPGRLPRSGRELCALSREDFCALAGEGSRAGSTLHTHLAILRGQTVEPAAAAAGTPLEGRSDAGTSLEGRLSASTPPLWGPLSTAVSSPSVCDSSLSDVGAAASPASIPASPSCKTLFLRYVSILLFQYPHCNEKSSYVFPEKELRGLSPNFHIHVSVSDLYIPRIGPQISLQQNRLTDCGNI
jgi:hypothetical protein